MSKNKPDKEKKKPKKVVADRGGKSCEALKAARSKAKGRHAKGKIFGQMAKAGCFRKGKRSKRAKKEPTEEEQKSEDDV